jgi:hypothetical protein
MSLAQHPVRLVIIGLAFAMLAGFAIRDSLMASDSIDPADLLFVVAVYGVPFLVFVFFVWTGRWGPLVGGAELRLARQRMASWSEVFGAISSGLFLLNLPLWSVLASHESLGGFWMLAGVLTSVTAVVCGGFGSPRQWRHVVLSALMLPCWVLLAGLLAKAARD